MLGEVHPPNLVLNTHIYAAYFNLEEVVGVFSGLVSHDLLQVLFEHFVLDGDCVCLLADFVLRVLGVVVLRRHGEQQEQALELVQLDPQLPAVQLEQWHPRRWQPSCADQYPQSDLGCTVAVRHPVDCDRGDCDAEHCVRHRD